MSEIILETRTELPAKQMDTIRRLVEALNSGYVRYCHWKSNFALSQSLAGQTDIDLLVHRQDAAQFREIMTRLAFRPADNKSGDSFPSMEHYFAMDDLAGVIVHVHVYFRVITGDSLVKNYRLPIENMLLENTRIENSLRVPLKSAELVVFVLRMMLKHTSLIELALLSRYWKQVRPELEWLSESGSDHNARELLSTWLPAIQPELFSACLSALQKRASLPRRILLGLRLRSQLKPYSRYSAPRAWLTALWKFGDMIYRRLARAHNELTPRTGGAVIAFVGSEATGKSTLLEQMRGWLGENFAVEQIHAGKPKSTLLTYLPNLLLPALRSLFPGSRLSQLEARSLEQENSLVPRTSFSLIFVMRAALLAFDRRALLLKAFRKAANGTLMLSDRYPSRVNGAPDSPQLALLAGKGSLRGRLARWEARLYRQIPPPDLVIYLRAPLEITLSRNANRSKTEPEPYVRMRHRRASNLQFEGTRVVEINTDQPFDQTVLEVKKAIWSII